jgi:pyruvate dehydrogenase E2 component (dihydrolipoamide acetyltransferase)
MPAELASASAAPAPVSDTPNADPQSHIPDPLDDVAAGRQAAVSLPPITNRDLSPQAAFVVKNFNTLGNFNLAYHEYKDQGISVVFNPKLTSEAALDAAYKKKDLFAVAPLVHPPATPDDGSSAPGAAPQAPAEAPQASAPPPAASEAPAAPAAGPAAPAAAPAAPAEAPAAPAGPLSEAKVPTNRRMQSARLQNEKAPGANQPNPTLGQLAKRAI